MKVGDVVLCIETRDKMDRNYGYSGQFTEGMLSIVITSEYNDIKVNRDYDPYEGRVRNNCWISSRYVKKLRYRNV